MLDKIVINFADGDTKSWRVVVDPAIADAVQSRLKKVVGVVYLSRDTNTCDVIFEVSFSRRYREGDLKDLAYELFGYNDE